jgi:hypothetical protein
MSRSTATAIPDPRGSSVRPGLPRSESSVGSLEIVGLRPAPDRRTRSDVAVLRAPQQQCWDVDPMQPSFESRIVHVGLPAVERERLTAA